MAEQIGTLSAKQRECAVLDAEDDISDVALAEKIGIGRTTIHRWRQLPEYQEAVADHIVALEKRALRKAIARKAYRVGKLAEMERKILEVIESRAANPDVPDAQGGQTGIVVRNLKMVGSGRDAEMVEVFEIDTPALRELRATYEQAAKELGQWSDNVNLTGDLTTRVELIGVDSEDV